MNKKIVDKFNDLNCDFYRRVSDDFSGSRNFSWQGWNQLLAFLKLDREPRILDLACGNGRFVEFLNIHLSNKFRYLGLDNSQELLSIAKQKYPMVKFEKFDVVENYLKNGKIIINNQEKIDIVALFGLSHHLPSFELRSTLFAGLKDFLRAGGLIIVSNWQFAAEKNRFEKNILNWKKIITNKKISIYQRINLLYLWFNLEKNDYLLDWRKGKSSGQVFRYCHYFDETEMNKIVEINDLKIIAKFMADGKSGKLNQYFVLADPFKKSVQRL